MWNFGASRSPRAGAPGRGPQPPKRAAALAPEATTWLGALAVAYTRLGRRAEAEAIDRQLDERSAAGWAPSLSRAEVAMALGRVDAALNSLERAADVHEPWVIFLAVNPIYEPLRAEPRFAALMRRLGLEAPGS